MTARSCLEFLLTLTGRPCGHRVGPWVCVKTGCDGRGHYYRKAA